jgi:hypothetical protein
MTDLYFWRLWLDEQRRPWADRWGYSEPAKARDYHTRAMNFRWVERGVQAASVSDLFADNGSRTVSIAEGAEWEGGGVDRAEQVGLGDAERAADGRG